MGRSSPTGHATARSWENQGRSGSGGFPTPALPPPAGSKTKTGNQDGGTGKSPLLALLRVPGAGVFLPPLFPLPQDRKRKRETKTGAGMSPLLALLRVPGAGVFLPPLFPLPQDRKRKRETKTGGQGSPPSWRSCVFQERGFSYPRSSPSGRVENENGKPRRGDRKVPPPGAPACFSKEIPPSAAERHDPTRKTGYIEATAFQPPLLLDGSFSPAGIVITRRLK